MSKVFFVEASREDTTKLVAEKIQRLWEAAALGKAFVAGDLAALKLHVGEPGTKTFVQPRIVRLLVERMVAAGARPFLTDTAVLYWSDRDNAVDHARVAHEHGFGFGEIGAPFISADGLNGTDEVEVEVSGRHFAKVGIAAGIVQARSMLVLTHATGHLGIGFGGALKNLGMGCSSRKAKLQQHHGLAPRIKADRCTGCGTCAAWCPADAITVDQTAFIDSEQCIGCGECVAMCLDNAVTFRWGIAGRELQERIVDHAAGVIRNKSDRIVYVTVAQGITKDCDCVGKDQQPLLPDVGFFASRDPVAIDQAVWRTIRDRAGQTLESMSYPKTDGCIQMQRGAEMGLGSSEFDLVTIEV